MAISIKIPYYLKNLAARLSANFVCLCAHTVIGGINTLAFDRESDALDEHLRAIKSNANLEFMVKMTQGDIIPVMLG